LERLLEQKQLGCVGQAANRFRHRFRTHDALSFLNRLRAVHLLTSSGAASRSPAGDQIGTPCEASGLTIPYRSIPLWATEKKTGIFEKMELGDSRRNAEGARVKRRGGKGGM
jgi:hypothetical protein